MRSKRTKHNRTVAMPDGGFLHIDNHVVPIIREVECHSCGLKMGDDVAALDEGDLYYCWSCVGKWEKANNADFFTGQHKK